MGWGWGNNVPGRCSDRAKQGQWGSESQLGFIVALGFRIFVVVPNTRWFPNNLYWFPNNAWLPNNRFGFRIIVLVSESWFLGFRISLGFRIIVLVSQ